MGQQMILSRKVLFAGPDSTTRYYRIPGIATAKDGTLVAVADRRIETNGDLPGKIDVVCRLSHDNGRTWSKAITIARHDSAGGFGDPAVGLDHKTGNLIMVCTHGNGLWQSTPDDHAQIMVSRSDDNGATWTKPLDITKNLFDPELGAAPTQFITGFASSGRLTQSPGETGFVLVARADDKKFGNLSCRYCYSRDGGKTWAISPASADLDGDEAKVVELNDGTRLMSIRNRRQGRRKFSRSTDGGQSWSAPQYSFTLPCPGINGDIFAVKDDKGREILLHTICDSHTTRENVSLFASKDAGETWQKIVTICPTRSAYSSMTLMPNGHLGVLTEEASSMGGFRLWFSEIDLPAVLAAIQ